jgi:hypothetical protein
MRNGPIKKLQSEPIQRQSKVDTPDISSAVEPKNDAGKPEREQVRQRQSPTPDAGVEPSATSPEHPNETDNYKPFMEALGTTNPAFAKELFAEQFYASARGADKVDRQALFLPLAVLKGINPKDELDAMHVAQMTAIHRAVIRLSGELAQVENIPHLEALTRAINQLTRTYTAQLEAHKRYCSGGEQNVTTVQNVSVTEGGQAMFANVTQAAHGARPDAPSNTTPALTDARQPAMDIIGESEPVPVPLRKKSKT